MTASILGQTGEFTHYDWSMTRDSEGFRDYEVIHRVRTTAVTDGPATVMNTPGLPRPGLSFWNFGNDIDGWAYCRPDMRVTVFQPKKGEASTEWLVKQIFSNRPQNRCQDTSIEDPLLEPPKVSGGFAKYTEEIRTTYASLGDATTDEDQIALKTSSHEPLPVTLPLGKPTVRIELNTGYLQLGTFSNMVNTVNDRNLWGLSKRKIRLTDVTWERKQYGACNFYYTRIFDFEVDFATVDRTYPDYGSLALKGAWDQVGGENDCDNPVWTDGALDPTNFANFEPFTSCKGARVKTFLSLGKAVFSEAAAGEIDVIYHAESNFLTLDPRIGAAIPIDR